MKTTVEINPDLIRWARERAGLAREKLAHRFAKYALWEDGEAMPTMRQLEDLARATHAPLGYFFLPVPPQEQLPVHDFRTVGDAGVPRLSPELIDTIQAMQRRQNWMQEYLIAEGEAPLAFVGSVTLQADVTQTARSIRKTLGLAEGWAKEVHTWTDALRDLRRRAEVAGIVVVVNGVVGNNNRRKLRVAEFRGFVLPDKHAPLIFVNGADAKAAQMFTLAHELAHIWLGKGGVFNLPRMMADKGPTERFCNAVAAEFLAPEVEFRVAWEDVGESRAPFDALARRFKVSQLVAARRALDLGFMDRAAFFEFYREYLAAEHRKKETASGGGDFFLTQETRIGRRFGTYVVRAVREGRLLYRDAYHLTGLHGKTFEHYADGLGFGVQ